MIVRNFLISASNFCSATLLDTGAVTFIMPLYMLQLAAPKASVTVFTFGCILSPGGERQNA